MPRKASDRLQGTIDLLVLRTLASHGAMHGYGITLHIQHASHDVLRVEEGSLYPALHRMHQAGWLEAEWGITENNRRARYYGITDAGRERLRLEEESWARLTQAVARVLKPR
ncbi:MAG: PadR family transcriptional regulator [Bryobacteraceae bacterium]|nr:PadR family transcriptional regulator [Bryobacteraceae bacterium]